MNAGGILTNVIQMQRVIILLGLTLVIVISGILEMERTVEV